MNTVAFGDEKARDWTKVALSSTLGRLFKYWLERAKFVLFELSRVLETRPGWLECRMTERNWASDNW